MQQEYGKKEIVRQVNALIAQLKDKTYKSPFNQDFAEVYVEDVPSAEIGETVPKRIPILQPPADEKRQRFSKMRRFANAIGYMGGANDRLQAVLFYKQAKFMEDFEDDYAGNAAFSIYFPNYQMMSYEQLRTYFTWRSNVRAGVVRETAYSYVFVYIYELIHNIGVKSSEDGLDKLAFIWNEYRIYEKKLDKYMNEWVKDYYITNDFPAPFEDYLQNDERLQKLYKRSDAASLFDLYYPYSDYKVKKSIFYTPQTEKMITACFNDCVKALDEFMRGQNAGFEDLIFYGKGSSWTPFSKALYCASCRQIQNKVVRISDTEKYQYENGRWTSSKNRIHKENGRFIIGYLIKRIEQFFRKVTKYKYKLNADQKKISVTEIGKCIQNPQSLFAQIDAAIFAYYKNSQRKTIAVNMDRLDTIRENAQMIQEKLLVNGEETEREMEQPTAEPAIGPSAAVKPLYNPLQSAAGDVFIAFADLLNDLEKTAARMIMQNASLNDLHDYSKSNNIMLEVLVDNINQKAIETVCDSIFELSDEITVFDEYKDDLKRVINIDCQ
jgi:hypothetical protein